MADEVKLLPCPFCGASEAFVTTVDQKSDDRTFYRVRCDNCEAMSFGCYQLSPRGAIEEWNTRPPGWRPIETAPDEDVVLATDGRNRFLWSKAECTQLNEWIRSIGATEHGEPTHWMPLPAPPVT